ncbi:MAG: EAL domain-containing protein [Phormidesmis sp.]
MTPAIDALLIEDNLSDAQLCQTLIRASSLKQPKLHHAERFTDAIATLSQTPFDVALLNLSSPDGNGLARLKQLRACAPQLPIVAMNSATDQSIAVAALKEGAQDYLIKPDMFSPERLQKLGHADIGNLLVTTLQYAVQRAELTKQLAISQERYQLAVRGANDGIWDWDLRHQRIYYSERWCSMLGLKNSQISSHPQEWFSRIHPDDRQQFKQRLREHLNRTRSQFKCEYRLRYSDGTYRWMLSRGTSLWDENNNAYRIAGSQTDITARKSLENSLHQEKELAQITLHSIGDAVITTDREGYIEDFNPVAERLTGWSAAEAKHKPITEVCTLIDDNSRRPRNNPAIQAIEESRSICLSQQSILVSKTGEEFSISDSAAPIRAKDGDIIGTVLVLRDVSEQHSREKQLAWQASHDPLTQLGNRASFMKSLSLAVKQTQQPHSQHVLCYLDLDHFKIVNDTCGHGAGDQLLQQIADLWRGQIRASDVLARVGGDEFGLLLYNCDIERAKRIAQNFCDSLHSFRFHYGGNSFQVGVSIGAALISANTTSVQEAVSFADHACYQAKESGRNCVKVYEPTEQQITQGPSASQWKQRLTLALESNEFSLHQQAIAPITHLQSAIQHKEILLRLYNGDIGKLMPPMGFIPTAERYHLMMQIDRWVVEHVLQYIGSIEQQHLRGQTVYSINLSASSLHDDSFVDFLQQQLLLHQVAASELCFEITETVAIANFKKATAFTVALRQLGCRIAIDDFGSSLSTLHYLKPLSLDYLKIDGRLIKEAATDSIASTVLKGIQEVAQAMSVKTIAKFVETEASLKVAKNTGINFAQGYKISSIEPLLSSTLQTYCTHPIKEKLSV